MRDAIQLHRAARWQERKTELDLLLDFGSRGPRDRAIAQVEAELPMRLADKVQHRYAVLFVVSPQPATQLLEKHECAFRRAEEEQCIDFGEIDTLVEQIHCEERPHSPSP